MRKEGEKGSGRRKDWEEKGDTDWSSTVSVLHRSVLVNWATDAQPEEHELPITTMLDVRNKSLHVSDQ